jgi:hypothetical protein
MVQLSISETNARNVDTAASSFSYKRQNTKNSKTFCVKVSHGEISGSHGGEYKDDCLLGCCAV